MNPAERGRRRAVDLAVILVARDVRAGYGGTVLGVAWSSVATLVQILALSFLFQRVVPLGIDDYPIFLFSGLISWQLALAAISGSADAFVGNRDLVRRPGMPVRVLPLVTVGGALVSYLLALPVVALFLAASGRLDRSVLALPVVVGVEILLLLGPAYVVATLNVRFRDTRHLVTVALGVVFYLTPVIYDPGRVPDRFRWVIDANPLAIPVRLHHDVLYRGRWPDAGLLALGTAIGIVGVLVAGSVVGRARAHLADDL